MRGNLYVNGELVGEATEIKFELEDDKMTKFNVGDEVRVLDVDAILYGSDDYRNGMVTEVLRIDSAGDVYLRAKHGGEGVFLSVDEFHAIELVKESDKMSYASSSYKTEKRKARVGERILITNAGYTAGEYNNGDVFTVVSHYQGCASPGIITKELPRDAVGDSLHIFDKEYEVIVENAPDLTDRVSELESRVAELESQLADKPKQVVQIEVKPIIKTPNQRRADAIKAAREYLANYDMYGNLTGRGGYKAPDGILCDSEFIVNTEKRTVVCLLRAQNSRLVLAKGLAKCAPGDVFNEDIGKAIALGRAKGVEIPEAIMNAPQPTEFAVGQVTKGSYGFEPGKVTEIVGNKAFTGRTYWEFGALGRGNALITDDTEAQY